MRRQLLAELGGLVSETRNPSTKNIDTLPIEEILLRMNREDAVVADAVASVLPEIARAVDKIADTFNKSGRLIYIGAGTSGRLGVLDASECQPTFGVPDGMVIGLIAGGERALRHAVEGAEDDEHAAAAALNDLALTERDVVVGLAVSGRTPYVLGGLHKANAVGALTVAVTCNPGSPATELASISISPVVGPEVLTGSTRLKSGTAQKLILNMLSTASMIRIGKTYQNLMVDLTATNDKLKARAIRVVMQATECSADTAEAALVAAGQEVKPAILTLLLGIDAATARARLDAADGVVRAALGSNGNTQNDGA
jgi:N-acetylmuramic acid 6-phosphate etherase